VNLLPAVTPPISGMVMEIKKAANLQEQRKGFVGNAFRYGNMAINDEGQPRVSEVSHCNVKGKEKRVNKGTETRKRKDGNGLEAQNDEVTFYKYIYIYIYIKNIFHLASLCLGYYQMILTLINIILHHTFLQL